VLEKETETNFDFWLSTAFSSMSTGESAVDSRYGMSTDWALFSSHLTIEKPCRQPTGCNRHACRLLPFFWICLFVKSLFSSPLQLDLLDHHLLENNAISQ